MPWKELLSSAQRTQVLALPTSLREFGLFFVIVTWRQRVYCRTRFLRTKDLRGDPEKLYKTNDRAENNTADNAPRLTAQQPIGDPAQTEHNCDRAEKHDARRPRQPVAADGFLS